jgi:hypothetical protein
MSSAYKDAMDIQKHGGQIYLPQHLHEKLPAGSRHLLTSSLDGDYSRKDSISSNETEDLDSSTYDVMDIEDNNGDSSDTDEFVPTSATKRKSTGWD